MLRAQGEHYVHQAISHTARIPAQLDINNHEILLFLLSSHQPCLPCAAGPNIVTGLMCPLCPLSISSLPSLPRATTDTFSLIPPQSGSTINRGQYFLPPNSSLRGYLGQRRPLDE